MSSSKEIESSRIPTSLFLLSTILLTATTRTSLEDKDEREKHREEELHGEEGELHREKGDILAPPSSPASSAPALLPRSPASSPASSAQVTRSQTARKAETAAGVIPSASASILSPRTEAKPRLSPTSLSTRLPSVRGESKLEEVLNYLDNEVFTDAGIKAILEAIDNLIDSQNLSNEDDLNELSETLQREHGITITPETISINISSKK
jgi:hypothetical protein